MNPLWLWIIVPVSLFIGAGILVIIGALLSIKELNDEDHYWS